MKKTSWGLWHEEISSKVFILTNHQLVPYTTAELDKVKTARSWWSAEKKTLRVLMETVELRLICADSPKYANSKHNLVAD